MALLRNDAISDGVVLVAEANTRALLIGGQPLNEPIAQHGPLVTNTQAEIRLAISDLRKNSFV
jgi:redox-sensitive bicupin YhaK (pirin superfamily)